MRNRYGSILAVLISVLLVDFVTSAYRSYRYYSYYRYSYYYYYYSSSSSSDGNEAGRTAALVIGILLGVGFLASIIIPIIYYCCKKRRNSSGITEQTGTDPTVTSANAYVAPPVSKDANGTFDSHVTDSTKTTGSYAYTPEATKMPPEYNAVANDSKVNGKANQIGQGRTDQNYLSPYSSEYVNIQYTTKQYSTGN